jgi:hypothetical protein
VLEVLGEINCSHPPVTDLFFDPVPVRYGGLKSVRYRRHAAGSDLTTQLMARMLGFS